MTSFTSAVLGQIHTPVNILSEFLATFNRRQKCKAAILSWLDGKHYYGHQWVRITFEKLADILGYCRETISRHMKELVFDDLIKEQAAQKFPKDTACEYQLNREKLTELLNSQRCEKIDTDVPDISTRCANNPPTFKTTLNLLKNNNTAVEEKKDEGVKQSLYGPVRQAPEPEPPQISHFADETEQDNSTSGTDPHEEDFSEVEVEVGSNTDKPSKHEIAEVCTELRRLRINPEPCVGVVKKYWANVAGAIARVKEGVQEGWCDNPTGLFINSCKSGAKGKNTVTSDVSTWFEWARKQRIVIAMSGSVVFTPDGDAVEIQEMMRRFPDELRE
ncbi:ArsR family transcriptional regulator [Tolypothrix sp. PCC 7910]|uniref:ArsR family transcriptional regulator n=1 Tax=Tolypothrix sp. PCC 7910 TaxID=2099387 RepID=UPI001FCB4F43|nr:ArsR family transcriptional regulator [Tolypothrix sp. PCC 7910]